MIKETPSIGRIMAMVVFALSCFGLLIFLWLSFGGPVPLKPKGYQVKAYVPEATTLAKEADVRMAGINVGKVKQQQLSKNPPAMKVTLEIARKYAPIPKDSKLILRQKTLLGETYVEITPGDRSAGMLKDGGTLARTHVQPAVQLDEIFGAFNRPTRMAWRHWIKESATAIKGRDQDLNDAFGNLGPFADSGANILRVLESQEGALRRVIRNTGVVFAALNERTHALHDLVVNSDRVFSTTAAEQGALRQIFAIFPTFLDESRLTNARLKRFSINTRPLVRDLKPVADDLGPTVRDLADLSPNLKTLFHKLGPLITISNKNLPKAQRFLRGAAPVFDALHPFLQELNPFLAFVNYDQRELAAFLTNGGSAAGYRLPFSPNGNPKHLLSQFGVINSHSFLMKREGRPPYERANAYVDPRMLLRAAHDGIINSFDCAPAGGPKPNPGGKDNPPCFVQGPHGFSGTAFPFLHRGQTSKSPPPRDPSFSRP